MLINIDFTISMRIISRIFAANYPQNCIFAENGDAYVYT